MFPLHVFIRLLVGLWAGHYRNYPTDSQKAWMENGFRHREDLVNFSFFSNPLPLNNTIQNMTPSSLFCCHIDLQLHKFYSNLTLIISLKRSVYIFIWYYCCALFQSCLVFPSSGCPQASRLRRGYFYIRWSAEPEEETAWIRVFTTGIILGAPGITLLSKTDPCGPRTDRVSQGRSVSLLGEDWGRFCGLAVWYLPQRRATHHLWKWDKGTDGASKPACRAADADC